MCLLLGLLILGMLLWRYQRRSYGLSIWGNKQTQPLLQAILARANVLMWNATVRQAGNEFVWVIDVMPQSLSSPLMRLVRSNTKGTFWRQEELPQFEEMRLRAENALKNEAPGYQQEFPVLEGNATLWLSEEVGIMRTSSDSWFLFGVITDVTVRHQAEESSRNAANQFRLMMERADCLLWRAVVLDLGEGRLDWSFEIPSSILQHRIFGTDGAIKTKTIYKGFQVEELPSMNITSSQAILKGESGYEQQFKITRLSDGQSFWIQEQVAIEAAGSGRWNLVGVGIDISSRHKAEEAHRIAEGHLRQIIAQVDCVLWHGHVEFDEKGPASWSISALPSKLCEKLFGPAGSGLRSIDWDPKRVPDLPEMNARAEQALRNGEPGFEHAFRYVTDGRLAWLHEQISIEHSAPGRAQVVGVIMDITAQRMVETALASEKERLAVTLRAMEEAVITLNKDGIILFMNKAAENLCKLGADVSVGRRLAEVFSFVEVKSGLPVASPSDGVLENGLSAEIPVGTGLRGSAETVYGIEGCCVPLRDPQSSVIGAVLVLRDVTERQRLEMQLQRASKLEAVGILAGGIAHDFNNILTAIMGNLDLSMLEAKGSKPLEEYLREAHSASARARDLTQQLLTFSKGGDPVRSAVNLAGIIEEVSRFALRGSKVRCETSLTKDLWLADADKGQLSQIVQNIVINAAQAMPEGGYVRISASNEIVEHDSHLPLTPGDYIKLSLADTGMGISKENLAKIFDPYFTTKQNGSGLGLATVYSIVRKHRGCIDVESEPGLGTTFRIRIPALRAPNSTHEKVSAPALRKLQGSVLVMDDEAPIRRLVDRLLNRMGLQVELAKDGTEAVQKYKEAWQAHRAFDLVIMDLTVPGNMGGCEALEHMRTINPAVKAIVASGYSSDPIMANFKTFGFCAMVAKPYEAGEFAKVVQRVMESPAPNA